jgi:exosortase E/protease (VPEID-CTERM system)
VIRSLPDPSVWRLVERLALLVTLLVIELLALSIWLDTGTLRGSGLTAFVANQGPLALQFVATSAVFVLLFGGSTAADTRVKHISLELVHHPIAAGRLVAHVGLMVLFVGLSAAIFGSQRTPTLDTVLIAAWMLTGVAATILAAGAFLPRELWAQLFASLRPILGVALAASVAASAFGWLTENSWHLLSRGTLATSYAMLRLLTGAARSDASTLTIGAGDFDVIVARGCSGVEGMGLMLVFTAAWLWLHHDEWRFPHALVLMPIGAAAIWIFNCVRIAALVLIGSAGARAVAAGGFHSQAGWLVFIAVALSMCVVAQRAPWLVRRDDRARDFRAGRSNPTLPYLLPLLATLSTAAVFQLTSSGFDWLYPLRVGAAAAALWWCASAYRRMDWRIGWISPMLGVVVFAVWVGLDLILDSGPSVGMPPPLREATEPWRLAWVVFRVLGSVVAVPVAEELAFRGFLLRRFVSRDFQSVRWQSVSWIAILLTSLAFGALHGPRWLAGTIAGAIYAIAMLRRGSIGDAAAAHATTNTLLAAWVLIGNHWQYW